MVDTQMVMAAILMVMMVGIIISIGIPMNNQLRDSMVSISSSTSATDAIRNSSENVDESFEIGSNIPIVGIAVVLIIVLVSITRYL